MIRYALVCEKGHDFESWFADSAAYDKQVKRGLVPARIAARPRSKRRSWRRGWPARASARADARRAAGRRRADAPRKRRSR